MSLPPIPSAWPSNRRRGPALADVSRLRIDSGEITDRVKAFQKKNGLMADGLIGKATWDKIGGAARFRGR
jgi:hypothetical protein